MKKMLLIGAALIAFACSKNDETPRDGGFVLEMGLTNDWDWFYVSLDDGTEVAEDADWDIAILRHSAAEVAIRTKTGRVVDGELVPDSYEVPIRYMSMTMGPSGPTPIIGEMDIAWSGAEVVDFSMAAEDMPPTYVETPANIFRSADGERDYRVKFTGYDRVRGEPVRITMVVEEL